MTAPTIGFLDGYPLRIAGPDGWAGLSTRPWEDSQEPVAATLASVVPLLEATARAQKETAEVLRDLAAALLALAARTGSEAARQRPRAKKDKRDKQRRPNGQGQLDAPIEPLTKQEEAVLRLLNTSLSLREIGQELYVSYNTVKSHTRAIYRKLGACGRREAVRLGRELALLPAGLPAQAGH